MTFREWVAVQVERVAQFRTRIEELEAQLARVRTFRPLAVRQWHLSAVAAHAWTAGWLCIVLCNTEFRDVLLPNAPPSTI